jgi:hypothetical protein
MRLDDLGFFGNIWVRQIKLEKSGDQLDGHKHHFNHVSFLTKGTVTVEVAGKEPKQFTAPTFVIMKKELEHKVTALVDDVDWFCVFALRDLNGSVIELYEDRHNPLSASALN